MPPPACPWRPWQPPCVRGASKTKGGACARTARVSGPTWSSTLRGATLTRQLLAFARQQPLRQDVYAIDEVIGSFEAVLRRAVRGSLAFDISLAGNLPTVMVDAPQVEAAILNLVVNACDATADGGAISLRTGQVELGSGQVGMLSAGKYVTIAVTDTGEGMAAEVVARAVEPFFTTKPVGEGTGLGLSHVYGLMQQSGGDVRIASIPGKGTTVSLYFPALPDSERECAKDEERDKALIVDDQPDVLAMAVELFQTLGYDVLSANNGAEALAILRRTPAIDVLFTDVVMPGMSGIELANEARRLRPDMKIVLASGYAASALEEDPTAAGWRIIAKPYSMAQVLRQLR